MKTFSFFVVVSALLAGCATAYQPKGLSGGFDETQLDTNVWRITFKGNGFTKSDQAEDFATLRSAEIALAHGFTHFAFAASKTETEVSSYTSPTTSKTTGSVNFTGNTGYLSAQTKTYGGDTMLINKPSAVNTVVMFKGKPENASGMIYDAQFICNSIGQKYKVVCNAPR